MGLNSEDFWDLLLTQQIMSAGDAPSEARYVCQLLLLDFWHLLLAQRIEPAGEEPSEARCVCQLVLSRTLSHTFTVLGI